MEPVKLNVTCVIPNYNGEHLLAKNLPRLLVASKNKRNKIRQIVVVDDASTDGSLKLLREEFPDVVVVKNKVNRGFSATVNAGVKVAKEEIILLLNNDVLVTDNFLEETVKLFKDDKVFAVSLHEKGYGPAMGVFVNGFIEHRPGKEKKKVQDTFWVSGGSGIFRRKYWMNLKGMDEKLFKFYWEDLDLLY